MVGYDESVHVFRRVDNVNVIVDLVVKRSGRVRGNTIVMLLNIVKSDKDKTVRDVKKVDGAEAIIKTLIDNNNEVSASEKSNRMCY